MSAPELDIPEPEISFLEPCVDAKNSGRSICTPIHTSVHNPPMFDTRNITSTPEVTSALKAFELASPRLASSVPSGRDSVYHELSQPPLRTGLPEWIGESLSPSISAITDSSSIQSLPDCAYTGEAHDPLCVSVIRDSFISVPAFDAKTPIRVNRTPLRQQTLETPATRAVSQTLSNHPEASQSFLMPEFSPIIPRSQNIRNCVRHTLFDMGMSPLR